MTTVISTTRVLELPGWSERLDRHQEEHSVHSSKTSLDEIRRAKDQKV